MSKLGERVGWRETMFGGAPRFTDVRRAGMGGMSTTYEALDRARGERVWVKAVARAASASPDAIVGEHALLQRLQMQWPPGERYTPRVHELFEGDDEIAYSAEHVDGVPLDLYLRDRAPGEDQLRQALALLTEALDALHARGVVHGDVKPQNVMVTPGKRIVLLGLELATVYGAPHAAEGLPRIAGTLIYMAPEVIRTEPVTPATDLYAVGVILFEALTGELPFQGHTAQVLRRKVANPAPAPSSISPRVPEDLDRLCGALLDRDPAKRPSADEIIAVLLEPGDDPIPGAATRSASLGVAGGSIPVPRLLLSGRPSPPDAVVLEVELSPGPRFVVGVPAVVRIELARSGRLDARMLGHIDIVVLCPGAAIKPLRRRLYLPRSAANVLVTPRRPGALSIEVVALVRNEPVHRCRLDVGVVAEVAS
jgi:serine/threonine protein kinase